jgi:hypothetical protein
LLLCGVAGAQSANGKIEGKITDAVTNAGLADVVVTATSPALQGEQTVVTDSAGEFEIPQLPPGAYLLHMEKENYKPLNQPNVTVRVDKTIRVTLKIAPESLKSEEVVVVGKPPTVDVGSTQTGTTVTRDFIDNIPIAPPSGSGSGVRSFESLVNTAPGAHEDAFGVSVGGATSPENNFIVDGVNVTSPSFGLLGSSVSIDFVKEVNVITGGYMPEFGRATGGVGNVVTKTGGNEYHGDFGLYVLPGLQARQKEITSLGEAVSTRSQLKLNANLVADVGGYIIKDKLWFYVGLEPSITQQDITRRLNKTVYQQGCPVDASGKPVASSNDPNFSSYSSASTSCSASAKGTVTDSGGDPVAQSTTPFAGSEKTYHNQSFGYQYIGKLTYLLNQDHSFTLSVWGNPSNFDGPSAGSNLTGPLTAFDQHIEGTSNDYSLHWTGSFLDKHVLADAQVSWHHESSETTPHDPDQAGAPGVLWSRPHSITDFEPDAVKFCGADDAAKQFPQCRVVGYTTGGPGFNFGLDKTVLDRYSGRISLTNLFRAAGHHEVKYGVDYELMSFDHTFGYSGDVVLRERSYGFTDYRRFGYLNGPDNPVLQDSVHAVSRTTSLAGFAQDSWRVLDLFTINGGVRWESQSLYQGDGTKVMAFPNNIMPRIGAIYDWTGTGRSKVFVNYGLFYESVPLDILDRQFPSQRTITAVRSKTKCDPRDPAQAAGICQQSGSLIPDQFKDPAEVDQYWTQTGGASTPVDPNLKGQSTTEVVAGGEYELITDLRVGATYTHREINRIVEDLSNDGGNTYFLANPGFGLAAAFPKAQRDYDAGTLYVSKTFSQKWLLTGSYTLSRLYGNYSGLFRPETGQLDPNITSDFDLIKLLANRTGPLPGDHTHNIKLYAAYEQTLTANSSLTIGGSYNGASGSPTNYLGSDALYGGGESYILPRGSGNRLPWTHDLDASFRYNYRFTDDRTLSASVDIFNLLNLQEITAIDEQYTLEDVLPIANGTKDQLANLHNIDNGGLAVKNPNFQNATSYQAPLSVRFGLKLSF